MFFPTVRVTPDPKYSAEVVVLLTTLGAKRTEFNAGKRARDLLEIKRAHHKIIDFNRDARQAGTGEAENKAIHKLMVQEKLQKGENDDLILPQIFIDGNYIGDANELQGLEDDELLEGILLRKTCMMCNDQTRSPMSTQCKCCWGKYEEILPGMMTIEQALQVMEAQQAIEGMDYEDEYDEECDEEGAVADSVTGGQGPSAPSEKVPQQLPGEGSKSTLKEAVRIPETTAMVGERSTKTATVETTAFDPPSRQSLPEKREVVTNVSVEAAPVGRTTWKVGDKVQYWSDTKKRWIDAVVEALRQKDGETVYDLHCKKGASGENIRGAPPR
jgi:hypothetical protein